MGEGGASNAFCRVRLRPSGVGLHRHLAALLPLRLRVAERKALLVELEEPPSTGARRATVLAVRCCSSPGGRYMCVATARRGAPVVAAVGRRRPTAGRHSTRAVDSTVGGSHEAAARTSGREVETGAVAHKS